MCMCFSPDGTKLACGTGSSIRVYDVDTGTLISESHQDWVNCVLWSRDGSRLFTGSANATIRCWNPDAGEQIGRPWTAHTQPILDLTLSPKGSTLASASWDKTVRFSPSGEFVASGGWGGKIYVWRVSRLNSITPIR